MSFYINDAIKSLEEISKGDISNDSKVDLLETINVLSSLQPLHDKWNQAVREEEYPYCFSAYLEEIPEVLKELEEELING